MRIIDTNKDYYDFYQGIYRDDTIIFDRKDSYELPKEEFASHFYEEQPRRYAHKPKNIYVLLEIGYCNWLFKLEITEIDSKTFRQCKDYNLILIHNWKNYNRDISVPIKLSHICFEYFIKDVIRAVETGEYQYEYVFNKFILWRDNERLDRHIPILKNIGIAGLVEPLDIYLALEEYFMKKKTESERVDPIGQTNDDKIITHGFDTKTSFRGKSK